METPCICFVISERRGLFMLGWWTLRKALRLPRGALGAEFVFGEGAIVVLVEGFQGLGGACDFIGLDDSVLVGVERGDDG